MAVGMRWMNGGAGVDEDAAISLAIFFLAIFLPTLAAFAGLALRVLRLIHVAKRLSRELFESLRVRDWSVSPSCGIPGIRTSRSGF